MSHLTARLVILLVLALMIITGVNDYVHLTRERDRMIEQTRDDARVFAETLALAAARNVRRGRTTDELQELLDEILARPGLALVVIFDPTGRVVARSATPEIPPPIADGTVLASLRSHEPASGVLAAADGTQYLRVIRPFRWPDGRYGGVEVRQNLNGVQRDFAESVREGIVSRVVVLLCFIVSIVAVTRWSIARPLRALARGARAIAGGDLGQRIDMARTDELGELAKEFNRMAESLQEARQALVAESEARLHLEREVQQAQKLAAVGMLAAEVAHELGTPLNVISGRAEVLIRSLPADLPELRHLEVILRQTSRIAETIRALLDYTRPRRPNRGPQAVVPLLARVGDLLAGRSRPKGVRLHLDLPWDLPPVLGDPDQLQQLFLNLLANAVDASPTGAVVRVSTGPAPSLGPEGRIGIVRGKADEPSLTIRILDAGAGLTEEQLAHAFEPFFSTKKRGHGSGLGLPIVEEIIRAHSGEVEMLSIPGRGTEVMVRLPLATADGAPAERPGAPREAAVADERQR
jgi:two-component system, NtrC family, sensor kinase